MPNSKVIILGLLLALNFNAIAQVQHNFKMDPEKTDCHEINLSGDLGHDLELIRKSTYRYVEEMKISRYHAPNKVEYYSCDGETGYLIATENDSTQKIFKEVKYSVWDSLTNTDDPIHYYKTRFLNEDN